MDANNVQISIGGSGIFLEGGDFGNPERAKQASVEGVWAYGRRKFECLSSGFGSRRGTKQHRNNKSHA